LGEQSRGVTQVALLRSFELRHRSKPVALPPAAQRLVGLLAIERCALRRVFVAGTLWTDYSEAAANANLRTALWRLKQLPCSIVEATPTHLSLARCVEVDLHRAAEIAHRLADGAEDSIDDDGDAIVQAGDVLPDWYDDWVVIERERFRQARLHALEALCGALARRGRYDSAIDAGLAAVAGEPLRESAHRAVILVHLAEGNRGEALRQYEFFRRLLREQLGLTPSPAIERLRARCVAGDGAVTAVG
jgi:DNA-binding SARP family transcriptional activator